MVSQPSPPAVFDQFAAASIFGKRIAHIFSHQPEKAVEFTNLVRNFKSRELHIYDFIHKLESLFDYNEELLLDFNIFLPKNYQITPENNVNCASEFVKSIQNRFSPVVFKRFSVLIHLHRQGEKDFTEIAQEIAHLFHGHQDLLDQFARFSFEGQLMPKPEPKTHPIQVSPSYHLMPSAPTKYQSKLAKQVLNFENVCKSSVTEFYAYDYRNKLQKVVDRCEDERFTMDMRIETLKSAAERVNSFVNVISDAKINLKSDAEAVDCFTAKDLEWIALSYQKYAKIKLQSEGTLPTTDLAIILQHMMDEKEDLERQRSQLNIDLSNRLKRFISGSTH